MGSCGQRSTTNSSFPMTENLQSTTPSPGSSAAIEVIAASLRVLALKDRATRARSHFECVFYMKFRQHDHPRHIRVNLEHQDRAIAEGIAVSAQGVAAIMARTDDFHKDVVMPVAATIDGVINSGGDSVQAAIKVLKMFSLEAKSANKTPEKEGE